MRNGIFWVCGLAMIVTLASCQTTRSSAVSKFDNVPAQALKYNDQAHDNMHAGELAAALENYDKALELSPGNPDISYNLGLIYGARWKEVMGLRGWDSAKMYDEYLHLLRSSVKYRPNDYVVWREYGQLFFIADRFEVEADWDKAAKVWSQARKSAENPNQIMETWLYEARAHINAQNFKQAKNCLDEALKINPRSATAANLLSKIS